VTLLLVLAGGALGATSRFLVDRWMTAWTGGALPWGTFVVNLAGSLLLGLVAGAGGAAPGWLGQFLGAGFCGALTTYSTFSHETVRLAEGGPAGRLWALLNVAATLTMGLGAASLGWLITRPG